MPRKTTENLLVSLAPGRGHRPEHWQYYVSELEYLGARTVNPDYDIGNPRLSLDDHADKLSQAELDQCDDNTDVLRVGWSFGANVVPRSVHELVKKIVFVAPVFQEATIQNHPRASGFSSDHGVMYEILRKSSLEEIRELAPHAFYNKTRDYTDRDGIYHSKEEMVRFAVEHLRDHPRREQEPVLDEFPKLPMADVVLENDFAVKFDGQLRTAAALGVVPLRMKSGHAPMITQPKMLAQETIRLYRQAN